jgi:hypothetical protein
MPSQGIEIAGEPLGLIPTSKPRVTFPQVLAKPITVVATSLPNLHTRWTDADGEEVREGEVISYISPFVRLKTVNGV